MELNKADLVRITLDYQEKFNDILDDQKNDIYDLKNNLPEVKSDFTKFKRLI